MLLCRGVKIMLSLHLSNTHTNTYLQQKSPKYQRLVIVVLTKRTIIFAHACHGHSHGRGCRKMTAPQVFASANPGINTMTTQLASDEQNGRRVFVKSDDTAQFTSRKITMAALPDSKQGFPVRIFAKRAGAVNVAVKATAISTAKLAQDSDIHIVVIPSFRENRNEVSLYVEDIEKFKSNAILTTSMEEYTVGSKTDIKIAAGAIAGSARDKHSVAIKAIGPDAVFNAIRAVAVAREYLEEKEDGIDLFLKVEYAKVQLDGRDEETTAVKLTCFLHQGRIEGVPSKSRE